MVQASETFKNRTKFGFSDFRIPTVVLFTDIY